jgi:hypothetical protein
MFKPAGYRETCFEPRYSFEPLQIQEQVEQTEQTEQIYERPLRPPKYLPGERLLKSIANKKKEKEGEEEIDIDRITKSMSKILRDL